MITKQECANTSTPVCNRNPFTYCSDCGRPTWAKKTGLCYTCLQAKKKSEAKFSYIHTCSVCGIVRRGKPGYRTGLCAQCLAKKRSLDAHNAAPKCTMCGERLSTTANKTGLCAMCYMENIKEIKKNRPMCPCGKGIATVKQLCTKCYQKAYQQALKEESERRRHEMV